MNKAVNGSGEAVISAFESERDGFRVLGLRSARVELRCCPDLGGRVCSVVSLRSGREWLWRRREGPVLFSPDNPLDFEPGTFAGLDERLPTAGACSWGDGRMLPDHGDLSARPWTVAMHDQRTMDLRAECSTLGLWHSRRLSLIGGAIRFEYELVNAGALAAPALWPMHPLFTLEAGDRLTLP